VYELKPFNTTPRLEAGPKPWSPAQTEAYFAGLSEGRRDGLVFLSGKELGGFTGAGAEPFPIIPARYQDRAGFYAEGWSAGQKELESAQAAPQPMPPPPSSPPLPSPGTRPPAPPAPELPPVAVEAPPAQSVQVTVSTGVPWWLTLGAAGAALGLGFAWASRRQKRGRSTP
jgi:hypothetical protein